MVEQTSFPVIPSKEHTVPLIAYIDYTTDIESDALVRIYDGVVAPRDEAFLVERKELGGRTLQQIQEHFCLAFTPRFLCDAKIPVGHKVVIAKITNAAGKQVKIYKARTMLELFSERTLTPENIAFVKLKGHLQTSAKS